MKRSVMMILVAGIAMGMATIASAENFNMQSKGVGRIESYAHVEFSMFYQAYKDAPVYVMQDGGNMYSGERYQFNFETKSAGYVYGFQIDSSATAYRISPLEEFRGRYVGLKNPMESGVVHTFPGDSKWYVLDDTTGIEYIIFVYSDIRVAAFEDWTQAQIDNGMPAEAIVNVIYTFARMDSNAVAAMHFFHFAD